MGEPDFFQDDEGEWGGSDSLPPEVAAELANGAGDFTPDPEDAGEPEKQPEATELQSSTEPADDTIRAGRGAPAGSLDRILERFDNDQQELVRSVLLNNRLDPNDPQTLILLATVEASNQAVEAATKAEKNRENAADEISQAVENAQDPVYRSAYQAMQRALEQVETDVTSSIEKKLDEAIDDAFKPILREAARTAEDVRTALSDTEDSLKNQVKRLREAGNLVKARNEQQVRNDLYEIATNTINELREEKWPRQSRAAKAVYRVSFWVAIFSVGAAAGSGDMINWVNDIHEFLAQRLWFLK